MVALLLGLMFNVFAEEPTVRLKEVQLSLPNGPVFLKDIADLADFAETQKEALEDVVVASDHERFAELTFPDILKRIHSQVKDIEADCACRVRFSVPHSLKASSPLGDFHYDKVRAQILHKLQALCSECKYNIGEFSLIRGSVPTNYRSWNVQVVPQELLGPSMVRVYFDQDAFNPLILQTLVRSSRQVLEIKQAVPAGTMVTAEMFAPVQQDVTFETKNYARAEDLVGREARRSLVKGNVLSVDDLTEVHVMKIGQPVSVEVQNGNFQIEMSGLAQRNGKLGEKIPIRLLKTQKQVMAEVISQTRARM